MTAADMIAVEATDTKYYGLKHMPGGRPLDKDGKGIWPADQFTFRLIGEGALREPVASPAAVPAPAASPASAPVDPLAHLRDVVAEAEHEIAALEAAQTSKS